tara:strand:- start:8592 stop:8960 length:369 start_codon:yes stop_codon:yes gene_type:complete
MSSSKTLVLGASLKPSRYSNKAILSLIKNGHKVLAVGNIRGITHQINVTDTFPDSISDIDTVTLYLNAKNQKPYLRKILNLKPKRIIFNPGAENHELARIAKENNIQIIEGCTLVMLSLNQY